MSVGKTLDRVLSVVLTVCVVAAVGILIEGRIHPARAAGNNNRIEQIKN